MFAFLNNLSLSPDDYTALDNWEIIAELCNISSIFQDYSIRKLRVIEGFFDAPIANSHSLSYYAMYGTQDRRQLILTLAGNRLEVTPSEINLALNEIEGDNVIDVTLDNHSSKLLTEAYVMKCPTVSLPTKETCSGDFLNCNFHILDEKDYTLTNPIVIHNITNANSFNVHKEFLIEWKHKILFSKSKWNPRHKPIWNDMTKNLLDKCKFPLSPLGKRDKKVELLEIGTLVAELNAWQYDEAVTKKNKNSGQLRKIFKSKNCSSPSYLSIDFESAYGMFELHDDKGRHLGEIKFIDGEMNGEADTKGHHNIII
jgi:hypothetical protein